ncbi:MULTISPECIES: DUF3203 family protein [Pseudomonas]|uniref:Uncharacterized protein n=2 Tax=Pseudomonas cichorii TaxID=36746 RepID=A0ABQ1DGD6_PSECI|nr:MULTISPECIES: DUF3203 family protein [Pseudomonas]AHF67637.1 hypothetical protein PCH70_24840 [Pseudomonas cichorii JBC1]QVE19474.1 DUF3203 family protein [Pseudomonas cichorii]GFM90074.1 hypothetical protein PSCICP_00460 [Pseudomonas cichorii]SDO86195.1 Protein of unknown function [Pseudomonas cichorii]
MTLEFDSAHQSCSVTFHDRILRSLVADVIITTNDATHMSEALIDGQHVPITEADADALTVQGAQDKRHHTVRE